MTPKTHGGARPGSGRRKLGKVTVVLRLEAKTHARLVSVAEAQAASKSVIADRVLSEALK